MRILSVSTAILIAGMLTLPRPETPLGAPLSEVVISDPAYCVGRPPERAGCSRSTTCTSSSAPATASPRSINGVTYHVDAGETLAVLGESGSGK